MALGGNLEIICSGSAPLQSRLARVFSAAGMTIAEAYGLTETSPAISVNDLRNGGLKDWNSRKNYRRCRGSHRG